MPKKKSEPPRGVLNQKTGAEHFGLSRYHPGEDLGFFIEHYWIVRWDLREKEPFEQDGLSHPSVHLVFEKENTRIWGVVTGKFTRKLEGKGKVLGVKFHPGAFYPFYQQPVSSFTDDALAFHEVFGEDLRALESSILDPKNNDHLESCNAYHSRPNSDFRIAGSYLFTSHDS